MKTYKNKTLLVTLAMHGMETSVYPRELLMPWESMKDIAAPTSAWPVELRGGVHSAAF